MNLTGESQSLITRQFTHSGRDAPSRTRRQSATHETDATGRSDDEHWRRNGDRILDDARAQLPLDPSVHRIPRKPGGPTARSGPAIRGEQGADRGIVDQ